MAKKAQEPLRVGLFVGREWSWPPAFIEEVNRRQDGVVAEYVKIGGTMMDDPCPYRVIIDRISHEVPYYRSYLKNAVLQGVKVINDPFMWSADDKFFDASLATKLGVVSPKTLVLPNKDYVPGIIHDESLRNLKYPLDWNYLVEQIGGMPCVLKDAHGGGWKEVYIVYSIAELIWRYNQSGLRTMILQEYIQWDNYARCYCLGGSDVHVMKYKPGKDGQGHYHDDHDFPPELYDRLVHDSTTLCQAVGYDMNAVEFAIKDGVPYVIEYMNPAPDMDVNSLGRKNFDWMVTHMADMAVRLAKSNERTIDRYVWARLLKGKKSAGSSRGAK